MLDNKEWQTFNKFPNLKNIENKMAKKEDMEALSGLNYNTAIETQVRMFGYLGEVHIEQLEQA